MTKLGAASRSRPSPSAEERARAVVGSAVGLSRAEAARLEPYLRPYRASAGTTLFAEGELCRELVLLEVGIVRAFYVHEDREVNLRLLCAPAAAVALSSVIRRAPSEETVQALTDVVGVMFRLVDFVEAHPGETSERILRVLAERHYLSMERRLRTLQWKSARERYAYFTAHMERDLVERVPGVHVASYLGVRPESLSRVRRQR